MICPKCGSVWWYFNHCLDCGYTITDHKELKKILEEGIAQDRQFLNDVCEGT